MVFKTKGLPCFRQDVGTPCGCFDLPRRHSCGAQRWSSRRGSGPTTASARVVLGMQHAGTYQHTPSNSPRLHSPHNRVSTHFRQMGRYSPEMLQYLAQHAVPRGQTRDAGSWSVPQHAPDVAAGGTRMLGRESQAVEVAAGGGWIRRPKFLDGFRVPAGERGEFGGRRSRRCRQRCVR